MGKVLGIFMIVIGAIIFISAFFTLLADLPKIIKLNDAESYGFLIGYLVMSALFFLLSVWMIRKGARMFKPKEKEKSVEEKIGEI